MEMLSPFDSRQSEQTWIERHGVERFFLLLFDRVKKVAWDKSDKLSTSTTPQYKWVNGNDMPVKEILIKTFIFSLNRPHGRRAFH